MSNVSEQDFHAVCHVLARELVSLEAAVDEQHELLIRLDERSYNLDQKIEGLQKAFYRRAVVSGGTTGGILYILVESIRKLLELGV